MRLSARRKEIEKRVEEMFGKKASFVSPLIVGGFNLLYRFHLEDTSPDILVRLPIPSLVQFPEEKTMQEGQRQSI
jgi:hypothetical protein